MKDVLDVCYYFCTCLIRDSLRLDPCLYSGCIVGVQRSILRFLIPALFYLHKRLPKNHKEEILI
jgi:hypothetical protein